MLDEELQPASRRSPEASPQLVERIGENCEPALTTVLFMAGAGGSLRAGVTENPVLLTRGGAGVADPRHLRRRARHVWPGGGITLMADVLRMPDDAFGYVPTPALVAPIEFTLRRRSMQRWAAMWTMWCRWRGCWPTAQEGGSAARGHPWPMSLPRGGNPTWRADRRCCRMAAASEHGPIDL